MYAHHHHLLRFFLSPPDSPTRLATIRFSSTSALISARSASHAAQTGRVPTLGAKPTPGQPRSSRICIACVYECNCVCPNLSAAWCSFHHFVLQD